MANQRPTRVLDVFSGAGGFSLGFQMAGFVVVGAVERDQWACDTFKHNHPHAEVICTDIESLEDSQLLRHFGHLSPDVLVGGPPCQGFSVCRRETAGDPSDPRNSLFTEFVRVARVLSPQYVVMENVPNLLKARTKNHESVLKIIESELRKLDYHVYHEVLQATDFGIPQIRKRLFIVGSKHPLKHPFPRATHYVADEDGQNLFINLQPCPTLWQAISDLPALQAGEGNEVTEYSKPPLTSYQKLMRSGSTHLYNHKAMNHTKRMVQRFAAMACGESVSDVPDHLRPFRRNSNGTKTGKGYDQNNRRMHPDRPCHTIPASFYANFVHPYQHRNFTAREGARLQSFPDSFIFLGKPTVVSHKLLGREGRHEELFLCQYNQIGNAVPPLLSKVIADQLLAASTEQSSTPFQSTPEITKRHATL